MRRFGRTGAYVAAGVVLGLAAGVALGAAVFGDGDSRRSGSFVIGGRTILSFTCDHTVHQSQTPPITLYHTSAASRFRLPGEGSVQARIIFYRNGVATSTEDWGAATFSAAEGVYVAAHSVFRGSGEQPDRARVEWRVGKDMYPMFAAC
jgi:hypothetical protein